MASFPVPVFSWFAICQFGNGVRVRAERSSPIARPWEWAADRQTDRHFVTSYLNQIWSAIKMNIISHKVRYHSKNKTLNLVNAIPVSGMKLKQGYVFWSFFNSDLWSTTSMESSRRDLLNHVAGLNIGLPWKITKIRAPVLVSHPKQVLLVRPAGLSTGLFVGVRLADFPKGFFFYRSWVVLCCIGRVQMGDSRSGSSWRARMRLE